MTGLPWFRFYSEAIGDVKFSKIARTCGMSKAEAMGAWLMILCAANDSPERGSLYVTLQERYTVDDVTELICFQKRKAQKFILALVKMDMLKCKYGVFYVVNWDKRQYASDNSGDRVRKHREIKRMKQVGNVTVTPPDTDTDTDTEKDISSVTPFGHTSAFIANLLKVNELNGGAQAWNNGCKKLIESNVTEQDIKDGYQNLLSSEKGYTIIGPQSLVVAAINARMRRENPPKERSSTNGAKPTKGRDFLAAKIAEIEAQEAVNGNAS